ncbi:hypothetical protein, partial [Segatella copri]|uniref:hypothetical protein n=1 Tax=Segatella copri TaxID=165179 RepID=UPI001D17A32B
GHADCADDADFFFVLLCPQISQMSTDLAFPSVADFQFTDAHRLMFLRPTDCTDKHRFFFCSFISFS